MEKKLISAVLVFVVGLLLLAFLFPSKKEVYNIEQHSFAAMQSTTLYFKNTRAFYYGLTEMDEAGFNVYRFGKTLKTDTSAYLNFILVHNWRADEVYVATEPSPEFLAMGPVDVLLGDTTFTFNKAAMNNEAQYDFAAVVFLALLKQKEVRFSDSNKNIFGNTANQDANFTVLEDYFKWVYKYR